MTWASRHPWLRMEPREAGCGHHGLLLATTTQDLTNQGSRRLLSWWIFKITSPQVVLCLKKSHPTCLPQAVPPPTPIFQAFRLSDDSFRLIRWVSLYLTMETKGTNIFTKSVLFGEWLSSGNKCPIIFDLPSHLLICFSSNMPSCGNLPLKLLHSSGYLKAMASVTSSGRPADIQALFSTLFSYLVRVILGCTALSFYSIFLV